MNTRTYLEPNLRVKYWLFLFIFIHTLGWTLAPLLIRNNLPMDSIEGAMWGHQLEWGYDKNPFLNGWLTALAMHLDHYHDWLIYLFSQISVGICFYMVFQLAKEMLPKIYALVSVLILEGIQYYNFHAIDFNDNTLELSLWATTIFFFYQALRKPTYFYWIITGIIAAIGMMAKYYTAVLLTSLALFLLFRADNRKQLTTLPPYIGLLFLLIIITPHCIWLFHHKFVTINYIFLRTASPYQFVNHFIYPARFAWEQLQVLLPAIVLLLSLFTGKFPLRNKNLIVNTFDKQFLLFAGLGPFILTLLLSLFTAIKLHAGWGTPLLSLWGILAMTWLKPNITRNKLQQFIIAVFVFMSICFSIYTVTLLRSRDTSSANFPGKEIANAITQYWHEQYPQRLAYVAGSRWLGGNVGFYSNEHPAVFAEWDEVRSPWINLAQLKKQGAVFLWDISKDETLPAEVKKHFYPLENFKVLTFNWTNNYYGLAPIKIGVAILPPG